MQSSAGELDGRPAGAESGDLGVDGHVEDGEETDRNDVVVGVLVQLGPGTRGRTRTEVQTSGGRGCSKRRRPRRARGWRTVACGSREEGSDREKRDEEEKWRRGGREWD
jgi:hypothetical protein